MLAHSASRERSTHAALLMCQSQNMPFSLSNMQCPALFSLCSMEWGMSRPVATFGNPPLCGKEQKFEASALACALVWGWPRGWKRKGRSDDNH